EPRPLTTSPPQCCIASTGEPPIRLANVDPDEPFQAGSSSPDNLRAVIGRPIVYNDDFDMMTIFLRNVIQRMQGLSNRQCSVVDGYDDAELAVRHYVPRLTRCTTGGNWPVVRSALDG